MKYSLIWNPYIFSYFVIAGPPTRFVQSPCDFWCDPWFWSTVCRSPSGLVLPTSNSFSFENSIKWTKESPPVHFGSFNFYWLLPSPSLTGRSEVCSLMSDYLFSRHYFSLVLILVTLTIGQQTEYIQKRETYMIGGARSKFSKKCIIFCPKKRC